MCGVTAIIRHSSPNSRLQHDIDTLHGMTSLIQHRGPDHAGYSVFQDGAVLLGHVRLSIRDLSAGPQPFLKTHNNRTYAITYNGEIYDVPSFRKGLEDRGYMFTTRTDTEVVLALYIEYGTSSFGMLNGEFAFLIYDDTQRKTYAVRDRYGVKPLFYANFEGATFFASEAKSILGGVDEFPRRFSSRYLNQAIWGGYNDGYSPFADISSILPGHFAVLGADDARMQTTAYWKPAFPTNCNISIKAAQEGLRERLDRAVQRRLEADVSTCVYLSGGIDSAIVTGLAKRHVKNSLEAFNLSFTDSEYDERTQATTIATNLNVHLSVVPCGPDSIAANVESALFHTETCSPNPNLVGKYMLSKAASDRGHKVTLTGEGSDEILAGYPFFKIEELWRMMDKGLQDEVDSARTLYRDFQDKEARSEGLLWNRTRMRPSIIERFGFPSAIMLRAFTFNQYRLLTLNRSVSRNSQFSPLSAFEEYDKHFLRSLHPLHASMAINRHHLSNWIFPSLGDRPEMAHHLEGRTPFLDNDVTEFVSTLPPAYLIDIHNLQEKDVLKKAFSDLLPHPVMPDHKHPFLAPGWFDVLRSPKGSHLRRTYLAYGALKRADLFRPWIVLVILLTWSVLPRGTVLHRKLDAFVGTVLTLQVLHHQFIASKPVPGDIAMTDTSHHA